MPPCSSSSLLLDVVLLLDNDRTVGGARIKRKTNNREELYRPYNALKVKSVFQRNQRLEWKRQQVRSRQWDYLRCLAV